MTYHVKLEIGAQTISMIIQNKIEVPDSLIREMAEQRIKTEIQKRYAIDKHYRTQTSEQFYDKMIKLSNYEITDLNVCEFYDLAINFKDEKIINHYDKTNKIEIRQSKINHNENEYRVAMVG